MDQKPVRTGSDIGKAHSVIGPCVPSFSGFKVIQIVDLDQLLHCVLKVILTDSTTFFSFGDNVMLRSLAIIVFEGELTAKNYDNDFQQSFFSLKLTGT